MKSENLRIIVNSIITSGDGEINEMTQVAEATYKKEPNKTFLMYKEVEMEGTKTLLTFEDGIISIKRYGDNTSVLKIEKSVWNETVYQTPYGTFMMQTYGVDLSWNESIIELKYLLKIEGEEEKPSEVVIKIDMKRD